MNFVNFLGPTLLGCLIDDIWIDTLKHLPEGPGVYLLTETKLNMRYVGSSVNVRLRAKGHLHPTSETYRRALFLNANPRYITIEVLESFDEISVKDLRERESYWINTLNTVYPNGLNVNSPKKGTVFYSSRDYIKLVRAAENITPCFQLLKFSERLDFFVEMIRKTPVRRGWLNNPNLPVSIKNQRTKLKKSKFSDIGRPMNRHIRWL